MKYVRKNTIRFRRGNGKGKRGSVIVLVVAVLALLAVIGTVYIVSARSERSGATSTSTAINLENAQRAAIDQSTSIVGSPIYDGAGVLGGINGPGPFGLQGARRLDMPEYNLLNSGGSYYDATARDEGWLASNVYRQYGVLGNGAYADMTLPAARVAVVDSANGNTYYSPGVFNPATGGYMPLFVYNNGVPAFGPLVNDTPGNTQGLFRVVADPLPTGLPGPNGTYDARDDAFVQLLPFSEANGVRYRYGLRIIDTSRMANLNVGMPFNAAAAALSPAQVYGTFPNEYGLATPTIFNGADIPAKLNGVVSPGSPWANPGRQGGWIVSNPTEYFWLQGLLRYDDPSQAATFPINPFDVSDDTEMRSYGAKGTLAVPRAATVWPNTLANHAPNSGVVAGNLNRNFYTTYSWSRELRPYADPIDPANGALTAFKLAPESGTWSAGSVPPSNGSYIFPPFPARVAAEPDISTYTPLSAGQCADALTVAATNIATAMEKIAGYNHKEACAFAANYLTFRWNSWTQVTTTAVPSYRLANGPSYVDSIGPCLRTGAGSANYVSDLNSGDPNLLYLGYAAQPFINETAESYVYDSVKTQWTEADSAVELYNPYDVPLSLDDFKLNVKGVDIDFTGKNLYVPARGYFVLTQVAGGLDTTPTAIPATATKSTDATLSMKGAGKLYLARKYFDRSNAPKWAVVDQYDVTQIATPPAAPGSTEIDFQARPNKPDGVGTEQYAHWIATVHDFNFAEKKQTGAGLTLGSINAPDNAGTLYIPLYDRTLGLYADTVNFGYNPLFQRQIPFNIADFNRIMRITHQIDPTTGIPNQDGPVSEQLTDVMGGANSDQFAAEGLVHFDFRASPANWAPGAPPTVFPKPGDFKAVKLLECLSFEDRVSDFSINLGDNDTVNRGISKIRIPGQINVNTASPEVLATIPVLNRNPKLIGYILAYRWRTNTADPRIPLALQSAGANGYDFSGASSTNFPGYGIHAMSELQVPIAVAAQQYGLTYSTIYDRDQFWGAIYSTLTVRSDTFVVYAYLEAVRQNPRYAGGFDNSTVWYNTSAAAVSDDPADSAHPLLRVARKRWVSLIDRSQSNYSRMTLDATGNLVLDPRFTQPHVVATKDLPQ